MVSLVSWLGFLTLFVVGTSSSVIENSTIGIKIRLGTTSLNKSETNSHSTLISQRNTGIQDDEDSSKEEIARLLDILNTTSLKVSELVSPQSGNGTNNTIQSRIGPKEFISLIKLIEGVRKFVDAESTRVSSSQQDGSQQSDDFLGSSLKDIQKFFKEHEQKLGAAIKQASGDNSSDAGSSSSSSGDSSGDDGSNSPGGPTEFPILGGGGGSSRTASRNETSSRNGRAGLVTNFMKISSDMSRGVEERMRQAGSILQDSVTQVQNQIGSFMNRIGGFIRRFSGQTERILQQRRPEAVFQ